MLCRGNIANPVLCEYRGKPGFADSGRSWQGLTLPALAAVGVLVSIPASGASPSDDRTLPYCDERADIARLLNDQFAQKLAAIGLVNRRAVMEIYVSRVGNWSIILSRADGKSCVLMTGEGWKIRTRD
ncbi:hypothetical protein MRS76_21605 [Rhizobiaceae bacterium n13]|uniref:Uncharacterized protein n=1 Tax=Ferirhizobium litorale TaxID=2927786 RepID=A0AAE3U395_9HYPH|nr:hypothetical protein [Fererhizobium litorale]MDI7864535.1 hypothetical protein [Fererhizobium litorale]MDI7924924.1 hypothetical protein [Fererhizobium litorale]